MILTGDRLYYWDLVLTSVGNRYFNITFDSCLNRIEYHNKSLYKYPYTKFFWKKFDDKLELYANNKLLATLIKKDQIENPEKIWPFYRES